MRAVAGTRWPGRLLLVTLLSTAAVVLLSGLAPANEALLILASTDLPLTATAAVAGAGLCVTVGALLLVTGIRMARRRAAGVPLRMAVAPAAPAALLPSDRFRATDLLDIRDLQFGLPSAADASEPGAGISLTVPHGQTLVLVGDGASGATRLCQAILGVLPQSSPVRSGSILFDGRELVTLPEWEFRRLRRDQIGCLDSPSPRRLYPRARIGRGLTTSYPRQMTTASAQRVLLAQELLVNPKLVIAFDPARGLDPQAATAFLDLLHSMQRERGFTLLVVSTRLDVVQRCDRVAIMRAGTIVEHASVHELLTEPNHLHSRRLLTGDVAGLTPTES